MSIFSNNFPAIEDWFDQWKLLPESVGSDFAYKLKESLVEIQATTGEYNQFLRMSTVKTTIDGVTQYWWGYNLQVNCVKDIPASHTLQQFLSLKGIDKTAHGASTFLNFWCSLSKSNTNSSILLETRDCGQNDIVRSLTEFAVTPT